MATQANYTETQYMSLKKPIVGRARNQWGNILNETLDQVDLVFKQLHDNIAATNQIMDTILPTVENVYLRKDSTVVKDIVYQDPTSTQSYVKILSDPIFSVPTLSGYNTGDEAVFEGTAAGLVPPSGASNYQEKYLKGDGEWANPLSVLGISLDPFDLRFQDGVEAVTKQTSDSSDAIATTKFVNNFIDAYKVTVDTYVGDLQSQINDINASITGTTNTQNDLQQNVDAQIAALDARVTTVENSNTAQQTSIDANTQKSNNNYTNIQTNTTDILELNIKVNHNDPTKTLDTTASNLFDAINELRDGQINASKVDDTQVTNGCIKLGNLILQWGKHTIVMAVPEGTDTITFPQAFNTACYNLQITQSNSGAVNHFDSTFAVVSMTTTEAVYYRNGTAGGGTSTEEVYWFAIGV